MYGQDKDGVGRPPLIDSDRRLVSAAGKYDTAVLAGRVFSVANQAAVAVTAALATTWTGLGLANPAGSGKNIIIREFGWATDVVNPAEGAVGLMTTTSSGMADNLTARSAFFGTGTSIAYCDDGATIATPVLERVCGSTMEGAISVQVQTGPVIIPIDGSIILAPGRSVLTYHSIGGTASLIFHFVWEEVSV